MKNKKGFMLAEIIIVSTIVMIGLVSLFTLVNKMFIQYDKRVVYDTVDATYVSRGLAENYTEDIIRLRFNKEPDLDYLKYDISNIYFEKNNIVFSYIVRYNYNSLNKFLNAVKSEIGVNFYDYISTFINSNDYSDSSLINTDENAETYDFVIITAISDNCEEFEKNGIKTKECSEDNGNISFGHYKFSYDIVEGTTINERDDKDPPLVYNVKFTPYERGFNVDYSKIINYDISWDSYDVDNDIDKFFIKIYDSSNGLKCETEVDGKVFSINQDACNPKLESGKYYAIVFAMDTEENSAELLCKLSTSESSYCGKSEIGVVGKRNYKLNYPSDIITITEYGDVLYYKPTTFYVDFKISGYYVSKYIVKDNEGIIPSIGAHETSRFPIDINTLKYDFEITIEVEKEEETSGGDTGCLAEGTKILLASGKYKNIEDITYNDLLVVMDYQNGGITYQYPNWLEKRLLSDNYIKVTFSDDTIINVVKDHAFFSYDDNEFVTVSDKDKFHIGTRVAKLNNYKLDEVYVKNIEYINEEIYYHHVISTRYYNVIAEGIVTTDDVVFVTNLYGFNGDITWKNPPTADVYTNEEISVAPSYLFRGLRMYDGKIFNNIGMNKDMFINYLLDNQLNEDIWDKPKLNKNGKREWMVTTSDDVVTEKNKLSYLMEEGDYYTLKEPIKKDNKKFIGWLHTGENIIYQPGEKVEVLYGTHFIAKWDDSFNRYNGSDYFEKNE